MAELTKNREECIDDLRDSQAVSIIQLISAIVKIERVLSLGEFSDWLLHLHRVERSDQNRGIARPEVYELRIKLVTKFLGDICKLAKKRKSELELIRMWKKCVPELLDFCSRQSNPLFRRSREIRTIVKPVIEGACIVRYRDLLHEVAIFIYPNYVKKEAKKYVRRVIRILRAKHLNMRANYLAPEKIE